MTELRPGDGEGGGEKCRGRGGGGWKTEEGIHTQCSRRRLCRANVRDDVHFDLSLSPHTCQPVPSSKLACPSFGFSS